MALLKSANSSGHGLATRFTVLAAIWPALRLLVYSPGPGLQLAAVGGSALATRELTAVVAKSGNSSTINRTDVLAVSLVLGHSSGRFPRCEWVARTIVALSTVDHVRRGDTKRLLSALAISNGFVAGLRLKRDHGPAALMNAFYASWANDAGAYLLGPHIPSRPLPKVINQNKSYGGFLPGWALAALVVRLSGSGQNDHGTSKALVGVGYGVVGSAGDIAESILKRRAGTKDSGRLLPGYGGILDRVDSLLPLILVAEARERWLAKRR